MENMNITAEKQAYRAFIREAQTTIATAESSALAIVRLCITAIDNNYMTKNNRYVQGMFYAMGDRPVLRKKFSAMVTRCTILDAAGKAKKMSANAKRKALKEKQANFTALKRAFAAGAIKSLTDYTNTIATANKSVKSDRQQARNDAQTVADSLKTSEKTDNLQKAEKQAKRLRAKLAAAEKEENAAKEALNIAAESTTAEKLEQLDGAHTATADEVTRLKAKLEKARAERDQLVKKRDHVKKVIAEVMVLLSKSRAKPVLKAIELLSKVA